eukprot:CAMPEP_0170634740 /NCGR_PEP_ID=MMETSP0224-20130122/36793_1 /TAXON_ID=285029 /ORGANISM="Togula jolla, Strain CCCM 725" /LENGTH=76 /DNA_ID=CAMNT_0010964081 /DNA_START=95 /DNA_END=325 /DNA_ORIENTATION=-
MGDARRLASCTTLEQVINALSAEEGHLSHFFLLELQRGTVNLAAIDEHQVREAERLIPGMVSAQETRVFDLESRLF